MYTPTILTFDFYIKKKIKIKIKTELYAILEIIIKSHLASSDETKEGREK